MFNETVVFSLYKLAAKGIAFALQTSQPYLTEKVDPAL